MMATKISGILNNSISSRSKQCALASLVSCHVIMFNGIPLVIMSTLRISTTMLVIKDTLRTPFGMQISISRLLVYTRRRLTRKRRRLFSPQLQRKLKLLTRHPYLNMFLNLFNCMKGKNEEDSSLLVELSELLIAAAQST